MLKISQIKFINYLIFLNITEVIEIKNKSNSKEIMKKSLSWKKSTNRKTSYPIANDKVLFIILRKLFIKTWFN